MGITTLHTLTKRADFLRVQAAPRVGCESLVLHRLANPALQAGEARIGYTVTKRCGNAVTRNRIKRRLRAVARGMLPEQGQGGMDYVLIGKPATATLSFDILKRDFAYALRKGQKP